MSCQPTDRFRQAGHKKSICVVAIFEGDQYGNLFVDRFWQRSEHVEIA